MKTSRLLALFLLTLAACGSKWGTKMVQSTGGDEASMLRGASISVPDANKAFSAVLGFGYHFAPDLPEQVDRVDGVLTLRLGNDNEDSIAGIIKDKEDDPVVSYMRGLAFMVSSAMGGEPVDIVLCKESLDEPFYTVKWPAPE